MSKETDDLRATAEDLIEDAERVKQIEQAKLALDAGDPRANRLARESERIVRRMVPKAAVETELTTSRETSAAES